MQEDKKIDEKILKQELIFKWLQDEKCNVYTFRLTPHGLYNALEIKEIASKFCLGEVPVLKKFLLFREGGTKKTALHYHGRISCDEEEWKHSDTFRGRLKKYFPKLKTNKMFAIKPCFVKGKLTQRRKLIWAKTYIAKEGDLIFKYNHSDEEILECIKIGSELMKKSNLPIYRKIINKNKICSTTDNLEISKMIYKYYMEEGKNIPQYFHLKNIMRNIKIFTSKKYQDLLIRKLASEFDNEENQYY